MKRITWLVAAMTVISAFSGCGGGSVNGNVSGISLNVLDSIFVVIKDDAGKTQGVTVLMGDKPNICDTLKANREPKSATTLVFSMFNAKFENGVGSYLAPDVGSYTVIDMPTSIGGQFTFAAFGRTDANCTASLTGAASQGKSGLVKVSQLTASAGGSLTGTFDVSIGTQADKLTGNINAKYCDASKIPDKLNCE